MLVCDPPSLFPESCSLPLFVVVTWMLLCSLDPRSTHCLVWMLGLESRSSVHHRHAVASGAHLFTPSSGIPTSLNLSLIHGRFSYKCLVWVSCRLFPPYVEQRNFPGGSTCQRIRLPMQRDTGDAGSISGLGRFGDVHYSSIFVQQRNPLVRRNYSDSSQPQVAVVDQHMRTP